MNVDRALSPNFRLSEFSGWEDASPAEIAELETLTARVLQPTRDRWGPLRITSWRRWSSGELRQGAHGAGAVDFVPVEAPTAWVHAWMGHRFDGRHFGELIDERNHIHVTPPGVGGTGEILVEWSEGRYAAVTPAAPRLPDGTVWELPGFVVNVAGPRTWLAWLLGGALLLTILRGRR